jgi:hypothetical protein
MDEVAAHGHNITVNYDHREIARSREDEEVVNIQPGMKAALR